MGDRTTVYLTVLKTQADAAKKLFDEGGDEDHRDDETSIFTFYDVNYGELEFLDELRDAGIAYDSDWSEGDNYSSGTQSCRFTHTGDCIEKVLDGDSQSISLDLLVSLKHDYIAIVDLIDKRVEEADVLSWYNQEIFGSRYRAKKLIAP